MIRYAGAALCLILAACDPAHDVQLNNASGNASMSMAEDLSPAPDVVGSRKDAETIRLESMDLGECLDSTNQDQRCYNDRTPAELKEEVRRRARRESMTDRAGGGLCWTEYCPCDPPQGGPDQLLCDQIGMGKADPEALSVGKSMRETRRQIAEYRF